MTATDAPGAAYGVPAGLKFIDCDAHWTEPADLWSSRVSKADQARVPRLQLGDDGRVSWFLNDAIWASTGANVIGQGLEKVRGGHIMADFEAIDLAAWSVPERLSLMDDMGVHSQVIYPNGVGFASNHMFAIEDIDQRTLVLQTYNDFFTDLQKASKGRLLPQAMLPVWDMELTQREMRRMLDAGIRGFTLSDKPELIGLPELWEPYFDPMWAILNEAGAVANFHIGSGNSKEQSDRNRGVGTKAPPAPRPTGPIKPLAGYTAVSPSWTEFGKQRTLALSATQAYMSNVRIIANLCMSNLFDRYPDLKIVSAESGIGWVPFLLEALEYQLDEMVSELDEITHAQRRPTEYFRDHIYVMFWFERSGPEKLIADVGSRNILVETDVPHSTCLYPGPMEHFEKVLAKIPTTQVRHILQENAAGLYGITI
jgi:uncharacterized protein